MFGPKHDILELSTIPRTKNELQGIIGQARYQRWKHRWVVRASVVMVFIGCVLLFWRFAMASGTSELLYLIYLPAVSL